jgi:hypothetical protein
VTRRHLTRVFWLGAAAILVAAALISLVAVLKGSFSDTDAKILGTLAALLYCGGAALAGFALVDRGPAVPLGWAMVGLASLTFLLLAGAIWHPFWDEDDNTAWRLAASGALFLVAGLVTTTGLLLTRRPSLQRLAAVAGGLTTVAVCLTLVPIWRDSDPGSTLGKAMAATWILAALAFFLAPVLQRWSSVGDIEAGDRVLATLDDVELVATRDPGEMLVVTERPRAGERLVLRRRP